MAVYALFYMRFSENLKKQPDLNNINFPICRGVFETSFFNKTRSSFLIS